MRCIYYNGVTPGSRAAPNPAVLRQVSGLAVKEGFGVKYLPADPHIRNSLGFPEPVEGPVADIQQLLDICTVIIPGAGGLLSVQAFENFGKENQECALKLLFFGERAVKFCFHRVTVIN